MFYFFKIHNCWFHINNWKIIGFTSTIGKEKIKKLYYYTKIFLFEKGKPEPKARDPPSFIFEIFLDSIVKRSLIFIRLLYFFKLLNKKYTFYQVF